MYDMDRGHFHALYIWTIKRVREQNGVNRNKGFVFSVNCDIEDQFHSMLESPFFTLSKKYIWVRIEQPVSRTSFVFFSKILYNS